MTDDPSTAGASPAPRKPKRRYEIDIADRQSWPEVLTLAQVAQILSISPENARKLIDEGEIEAVKFGGQWRIARRWLIQRFNLDTTPPTAAGQQPDTNDPEQTEE